MYVRLILVALFAVAALSPFVFAMRREQPPATFNDQWPTMKGTGEAKVIRTIPITAPKPPPVIEPEPARVIPVERPPPERVAPPPQAEPKRQTREERRRETRAARRERRGGDVCARHGLRKVVTGRSWRCRK